MHVGRIMKNSILIQCSRCGITDRHTMPEHFVDNGWTVRNSAPFCPQCRPSSQITDEYEAFRIYFGFVKKQELERIAALRTKRK